MVKQLTLFECRRSDMARRTKCPTEGNGRFMYYILRILYIYSDYSPYWRRRIMLLIDYATYHNVMFMHIFRIGNYVS